MFAVLADHRNNNNTDRYNSGSQNTKKVMVALIADQNRETQQHDIIINNKNKRAFAAECTKNTIFKDNRSTI